MDDVKTRGYCSGSFLPHFQLNLIPVPIASSACVLLSPALSVSWHFLLGLCGCCHSFCTTCPCPVSLGCVGFFFPTHATAVLFAMHGDRLLFSTPRDWKHHFYPVGTAGSVSPLKLFSISLRQSNSAGNSCCCWSPFFFECSPVLISSCSCASLGS